MSISREKFEEMKRDRMSRTYYTSYGTPYKIVEYYEATKVVVEFQDKEKHRKTVTYRECQKGWVTNPFDKTVYNVGYKGSYNGKFAQKEYALWMSMMTRCYNENYHKKEPTYKDCKVSDRWLNFTNFLEDLPLIEGYELWKNNNEKRKVCLDKDKNGGGSKIYSLKNCCFILHSDNVAESNIRTKSTPIIATNIETGEEVYFNSFKDAREFLNIKNHTRIAECCNSRRTDYRGFYWKYSLENQADITDVAIV